MANLLKQINVISIFLAMGFTAHCQNFEHSVSIPLISYQLTNILQFDKGLNKDYINKFYLPNFRYELVFKQRINIGFESYYYENYSGNPSLIEGEIRNLQINSFSVLAGYTLLRNKKIKLKVGSGITYHHSWVGLYLDYYPQWWEGWICYEYNKLGAIFWSNLEYNISNKLFIGFNLRYSPMFKPFERDNFEDCLTKHNHDRLIYGVGQIAVGYKF